MSYPGGPEGSDPTRGGHGYPPNADPAYSGYWGPGYHGSGSPLGAGADYGAGHRAGHGAGYGDPATQPTEQLAPHWQSGAGHPPAPPPPPPRRPSRWLWALLAASVLLIAGLVLALVIVSNPARQATTLAPSKTTAPAPPPRVTTAPPDPRTPRGPATEEPVPAPIPLPGEEPGPTGPGAPGAPPAATETVVYTVTGEGRAINITYVDTGGIMQIEFNVALPWSKQVSLPAPARNSASVAVVNIGRDVTCSVTVGGTPVRQRTGQGLTICAGLG